MTLCSTFYGERDIFELKWGASDLQHIDLEYVLNSLNFPIKGNFLDGSGWTSVLTAAGVATSGKADSMLNAQHVT